MNLPSSKLSNSDSKLCVLSEKSVLLLAFIGHFYRDLRNLMFTQLHSNQGAFFSPNEERFYLHKAFVESFHIVGFFFFIYFVIGGKLLYDVMLVSAIQQCGPSLALCDDPGGERCRRKLNRGGMCM